MTVWDIEAFRSGGSGAPRPRRVPDNASQAIPNARHGLAARGAGGRIGELERLDADVVALVFAQGDELPETIRDAPGAADCKPDFKKLALVHPARPARVLVAGAGDPADVDLERLRVIAALVAKRPAPWTRGRSPGSSPAAPTRPSEPPPWSRGRSSPAIASTATARPATTRRHRPSSGSSSRRARTRARRPPPRRRSHHRRRRGEPGPRASEPARQRAHPVGAGRASGGGGGVLRTDRSRGPRPRRRGRPRHGRPDRRPGQRGGAG